MAPVLFVMMDGVRPDAIATTQTPTLKGLMARGATTFTARSVMPSITLPCHTSIFHSVPPARHGITSNEWHPMARPLPGLIELVGLAAKTSAFFFNWEQLRDLSRPGSLSYSYFRATSYMENGDDEFAAEAAARIPKDRWDFVFLYLGTVDSIGHFFGWMSPEYLKQLERIDGLLGQVLAALPADYSVIVHSDHGGHDRDHGSDIPEDMTIPWIAAGPGIKAGYQIQGPVSLLDTAPTAAKILGLTPHPLWEGHPVDEIFEV